MNYYRFHTVRKKLNQVASGNIQGQSDLVVALLEELFRLSGGQILDEELTVQSVLQLVYVKDIRVKKLVFSYLPLLIKKNPELYLHVSNYIHNDLSDPNPNIRISALRLIFDVLHVINSDVEFSILLKSLDDVNPNVKNAVIKRIPNVKLTDLEKEQITARIFRLFKEDPDSGVVTECISCLTSLNAFTDVTLLIQVLFKMSCMNIQSKFSVVVSAIKVIESKIEVISHEQTFQILNLLESCLNDSEPFYFTVACLKLMLIISSKFKKVHLDVKIRVLKYLLESLDICDDVTKVSFYCNINFMLRDIQLICHVQSDWKKFLILPNDLLSTRYFKVNIINKLIDKTNCRVVMQQAINLILSNTGTKFIIQPAMNVLFHLYEILPNDIMKTLCSFFSHTDPGILNACVITLANVCSKYCVSNLEVAKHSNFICVFEKLTQNDAKCAYLWLLSLNGSYEIIKTYKYPLKIIVEKWISDSDIVLLMLLSVLLQLFMKAPNIFKQYFSIVMKVSYHSRNSVVKNKAMLYHKLLKKGIDDTNCVIPSYTRVHECLNINQCSKYEKLDVLDFNTIENEIIPFTTNIT